VVKHTTGQGKANANTLKTACLGITPLSGANPAQVGGLLPSPDAHGL
jgi:hypothetical protein